MRKVFLITRVSEDKETRYVYAWCDELIQLAKKTWNVQELSKEKANRKQVEGRLDKQKPELVVFNGHGNETSVLGYDGEELISLNDNEHLLKGKNVFMRACSAGARLGKSVYQKGAKGFIGYQMSFIFWYDPRNHFSRPLEDLDAEPFRICSNQVAITLLKGRSIREAHDRSMVVYKKELAKLTSSNSTRKYLAPMLRFNMINQVCYDN